MFNYRGGSRIYLRGGGGQIKDAVPAQRGGGGEGCLRLILHLIPFNFVYNVSF